MDKTKRAIRNFIQNRYSRSEFFSVFRGFDKNDEEGSFLKELEIQWDEIEEKGADALEKERVWKNILQRTGACPGKRTISIWKIAQRAAAILFIPLLLTSLFYFYSENKDNRHVAYAEIQCPMGVRTKFVLPDGTNGFLNSGSSLKYPVNFVKSRQVSIQGEAYFDVFHDKSHPFTVQTSNLNIEVLGTKFNVTAYEDDLSEQICLNQGSVKVLSKDGKPLSLLKPDQRLILDIENKIYRKEDVVAKNFSSWTEGKLIFRDESMQQVITRLSRWYNVEFELENEELLNYTFRATFVDEPIEEVFKLLAISAPLQFEEQARESKSNDEYQKRKITIKPDLKRLDTFKK